MPSSADDAKAKKNDFKAWEQMRHGQGPVPSARPSPRYSAKSAAFSPARDSSSGNHTDSMPKRPNRDHLDDPYAHFPSMSRSHTTRTPKKAGFAPGTPGGDEPSARHNSAYFNVFRTERSGTSRETPHVPPPPPRQMPSAKKPDPLQSFKTYAGLDETYANPARVSTPYATSGGEKTFFERSASWKEGRNPSDFYESEPSAAHSPHLRPSSAAPERNKSSSPKMKNRSQRRSPSPLTSSSSSSDESVQMASEEYISTSSKPSNDTRRSKFRGKTEGSWKPNFQPSMEVDDAEDEDSARSGRSNLGSQSKNESRKQQQDHEPHNAGGDHPEGFMQHRTKREADKYQFHFFPPSNASRAYTPAPPTVPPRPLKEPIIEQDNNESAQGVRPDENAAQAPVDGQDSKSRMYEPSSSPPSSTKWSDQWPFMSPKKLRHPAAAPPPSWAIPSSLFPRQQQTKGVKDEVDLFFSSGKEPQLSMSNNANYNLSSSFTFAQDDSGKASPHPPSLKSHSSETINVTFSPDGPKTFTGGTNDYFSPSSTYSSGDTGRKSSPSRVHAIPHRRQSPKRTPTSESQHMGAETQSPPKDGGLPAAATEEWAQHFRPATFAYPLPPRSPAQKTLRKRTLPSRRFSKPSSGDSGPLKAPKLFTRVDDDDDEEVGVSSVAESVSSKISGDESPMDIDPALTPPSAAPSQINGESRSPSWSAQNDTTPRPTAPVVPPRPKSLLTEDASLNLGGLNNVAPLAPTEEGLKNLKELHTALPFESRPSNHTVRESPPPPPLVLPNPPKAPFVPEKLTQTAWERYIAHMRAYMFEWNAFNTKMLSHFNERQASVENVLKPEWMSAVGDGTERWGYKKYMQGLEEDCRVREHWDVSWERHRECMKGLGGVRERLLGTTIQV